MNIYCGYENETDIKSDGGLDLFSQNSPFLDPCIQWSLVLYFGPTPSPCITQVSIYKSKISNQCGASEGIHESQIYFDSNLDNTKFFPVA